MPIVEQAGSSGSAPFSFAAIRLAASVEVSGGSIPFDSILSDGDGYWDAVNTRFAVPAGKGGMFAVSASIILSASPGALTVASGQLQTSGDYPNAVFAFSEGDGGNWGGAAYALMQLRDGETVSVQKQSGDTNTVVGGGNGSYFAIARLGDLPA